MTKRQKVLKLRELYPQVTMQRIAEEVGLTSARVWQILKTEGQQTVACRTPRSLPPDYIGKPQHPYSIGA